LTIEILQPHRLTHWCELIDIPADALPSLLAMVQTVDRDPELTAVFHAFYEETVLSGGWSREWGPITVSPIVRERCGDDAMLFYLLAYLSALPHTWETYQQLGVGLDIFKATMLDFRFYMQDYFDAHGRWGYENFGWIWRHVTAELFRVGRLQYMLIPFGGGVRAFGRKAAGDGSGQLPSPLLLADPDMPLGADGYAWGAGRERGTEIPPEDATTWRPTFEQTPGGWQGHVVSPYGWVHRHDDFLRAAEWEPILQPGDWVLDVHIPRNDPFDAETCRASHALAVDFFNRVFPSRPHKALYCHTWIFTPQLQQMLPPTSHLVKFQREFYLFPLPGTVAYLWTFVFGRYPDPQTAPRDTSLRRAVLDRLAAGNPIFDVAGLMFHAPSEWGSQPYMSDSK